jgi:uncharacterized membrane protein
MNKKQFSIEEAVSDSWIKVKQNLRFFVPLGIIVFIVESLPRLTGTSRADSVILSVSAAIFYWLLRTLVEMGVIKIALKVEDGKKAAYGDLLSESDLLWNFLIGSAIYTVIVLAGIILFIVPGIIWATKYSYFSYLIIDKGMKPWDAIKKSGEITEGQKWHLFLLGLALAGINILGTLALVVGLFITLPVTTLAWTRVYRQLSSKNTKSQKK